MKLISNIRTAGKKFGLPMLASMMVAGSAMATANGSGDATFNSILTQVEGWATGSLGKLLAISAFIIGMGMGLVRQSAMAVVLGIAFALILGYGPTVITNIFNFAV